MVVVLILTHIGAFVTGILLKDKLVSKLKNVAKKVTENEKQR